MTLKPILYASNYFGPGILYAFKPGVKTTISTAHMCFTLGVDSRREWVLLEIPNVQFETFFRLNENE